MDTKDICSSAYKTGTRSLELPGPGAVAHMSLHLNQQCQRTADRISRTTIVPRSLLRGTRCPSMSATSALGPFRKFEAAFPSGEAASKVASRFGQTFFCRFVALCPEAAKICGFREAFCLTLSRQPVGALRESRESGRGIAPVSRFRPPPGRPKWRIVHQWRLVIPP